jgi:hypothetical protein
MGIDGKDAVASPNQQNGLVPDMAEKPVVRKFRACDATRQIGTLGLLVAHGCSSLAAASCAQG